MLLRELPAAQTNASSVAVSGAATLRPAMLKGFLRFRFVVLSRPYQLSSYVCLRAARNICHVQLLLSRFQTPAFIAQELQ